jgi:hypothetical protein
MLDYDYFCIITPIDQTQINQEKHINVEFGFGFLAGECRHYYLALNP